MPPPAVFFMRHAESLAETDGEVVDAPLSINGVKQASQLRGYYTCVVCSPQASCLATLLHSQINYHRLIIDHNLREIVVSPHYRLPHEDQTAPFETDEDFDTRIMNFNNSLAALTRAYSNSGIHSILIIGTSFFHSRWRLCGHVDHCGVTPVA